MAAIVFLATTAAALWGATRPVGPPAHLTVLGGDLVAQDASGRTLWSYRPDRAHIGPPELRWHHVGDLNGDARTDVLASLEVTYPPLTQHRGELLAFDSDGRMRWSFAADDRVRFRDAEYGPPWPARDVTVYGEQGALRIAWAVHHFTWWPSLLITLDGAGNRLGTFVNAGWIGGTVPSPDERHLLVTGTSNGWQAPFVAVLDAAHPDGRSPEPHGGLTECLTCPEGDPLQYLVLPRTDVSQHQLVRAIGPTVMTFDDGTVQVYALENEGPTIASVIYSLAPDPTGAVPFVVREARFSDSFWEWHSRLESDGRLDHDAEACPERRGLQVQQWTRARGWQSLPVAVR